MTMSGNETATTEAAPASPTECGTTEDGSPIVITAGSPNCAYVRTIAQRYLAELSGGRAQGAPSRPCGLAVLLALKTTFRTISRRMRVLGVRIAFRIGE